MKTELDELYKLVKKLRDLIEHKNTGTVSLCSTVLCKINIMQLKYARSEPSEDKCICKGFYQPQHCPIHGNNK